MRLLVALLAATSCYGQRIDPVEFFETKVRPVLAKNCFSCHTQTKLGGLEMTSRESLLKGGKSGPAIDPERPDDSLLIQVIKQTHPKLKMPPTGKLQQQEINDILQWVVRGAIWPASASAKPTGPGYQISKEQRAWWAFQPVKSPAIPKVANKAWNNAPIDALLYAAMEKKGVKPVAPASKRDWIRRVTYDLTGLPPKPEEVADFLRDNTPQAKAKVVDRLLASQAYGERWGRHWLDVARYSDDLLNPTQDQPYDNAFRYRDWVIKAFNDDLPYNTFVKAQLAGDSLNEKERLVGGLGFYALSPQFQDDRVDATSKAFLALTVACAQCHDHKFDPIPTKDYYGMLGVFTSTAESEFPIASEAVVKEYKTRKEAADNQEKKLKKYLDEQAKTLGEVLAHSTAAYVKAVRRMAADNIDAKTAAAGTTLDIETLERWSKYLTGTREHTLLNDWQDEAKLPAADIQTRVINVLNEQRDIESKNFVRLGGSDARGDLARADLLSLPRDKYLLWRDVFSDQRHAKFDSGILYYKEKKIERFLAGQFKGHLDNLRADLDTLKKAVPDRYPYYHIIKDKPKVRDERVRIRGSQENLGEVAPRRFLSILCDDEPKPFTQGSGRSELAEAIASPTNPLTPRVMVNRIWHHLFGQGIVRTLANFGQLGEKPSHPELLDYLAARFVEKDWSVKAIIREMVLTEAYGLSYATDPAAFTADPDNRLVWHATRRRLDIEALRDSLLAASGELDATPGGMPQKLTEDRNLRRTVYGFVSRRKLDGTLALFDFPNPNNLSEQRIATATPLQQLFFLNSGFVADRAKHFADRLQKEAADNTARINRAYQVLFYRQPAKEELQAGLAYLTSDNNAWPKYAQVLLSSNEFVFY